MLRSKGTLLLLAALLALVLWRQSDRPPEATVGPVEIEFRTVVADGPTGDNLDGLVEEFSRLAIRVARLGCANTDERLSGEPTRILVSLTQSIVAHRFISPDSRLARGMGPGFIGSEAALVVAVEGQVVSESGYQRSMNPRSFVFVEPVGNPEFTTCVVRESPLSLNQSDFLYGSFDFEEIDIPG